MILIVDTNKIIAALIKDSTSRQILMSNKFSFFTVNFSKSEIEKYRQEILEKAKITDDEFNKLLHALFKKIELVSDFEVDLNMADAKEIMDKIDPKDTPFIAAALAKECGIWSEDQHYQKQKEIKIWKTNELIMFL